MANVLTHALGLVLAAVGFVAVMKAAQQLNGWGPTVVVGLYGLTVIAVYLSSTGFHLARHPEVKLRWRTFDHISIYGLIAGTYTPVVLLGVGGFWGWTLFSLVWGMAVLGILAKTLLAQQMMAWEKLDLVLYIGMGWLGGIAILPIINSIGMPAFVWLVAGGVTYTVGCIFYLWDRLPFNHAIWHVFVIGGSVCHYIVIYQYILQPAA